MTARLAWLLGGVLACAGGGCVPIPEGFDSPEPAARLKAAAVAAGERDQEAIPHLLEMLRSEDPAARLVAARSLERVLGREIAFDPSGPEAERSAQAWALERSYAAGELDPGGGR